MMTVAKKGEAPPIIPFKPKMKPALREELYAGWQAAVARVRTNA